MLGSVSPIEGQVLLSLPQISHLRAVSTMRYGLLVFLDTNRASDPINEFKLAVPVGVNAGCASSSS